MSDLLTTPVYPHFALARINHEELPICAHSIYFKFRFPLCSDEYLFMTRNDSDLYGFPFSWINYSYVVPRLRPRSDYLTTWDLLWGGRTESGYVSMNTLGISYKSVWLLVYTHINLFHFGPRLKSNIGGRIHRPGPQWFQCTTKSIVNLNQRELRSRIWVLWKLTSHIEWIECKIHEPFDCNIRLDTIGRRQNHVSTKELAKKPIQLSPELHFLSAYEKYPSMDMQQRLATEIS